MGANAACVAATVSRTDPATHEANVAPHGRGRLARLARPVLATSVVVLVLAASFGILIWRDHRHKAADAYERAVHRMDFVAGFAVLALGPILADDEPTAEHLRRLVRMLPPIALTDGRRIFLADGQGDIVAAEPPGVRPANLSDMADGALVSPRTNAVQVVRSEAGKLITTVRSVGRAHVAFVQPLAEIRKVGDAHRTWILAVLIGGSLALAGLAVSCGLAAHLRRFSPEAVEAARVRRRLESALCRGRCGLWDWDFGKGRVYWSPSLYEILGYQPCDSLTVGEIKALLHPDDRAVSAIEAMIADPACTHVEQDFRVRTADGGWVWLRARADVVREGRRGQVHLVGIAVDVTAEREARDRSAAADERLRDAVEAISESFVIWDAERRLILCNSRFRKLHDLSANLVRPGASYDEIAEAVRVPITERQTSGANLPRPGSRTLETQLPNGRWLHVSERRTRDGGYVSVGTDITELKHQQQKLVASEQRLTSFVRELKRSRREAQVQAQRLADLAERYHEQRDEAESASRAKTEFLAKMSHELRTPLNAIMGFADVMRGGYYGPLGHAKYTEYVGDILASGQDLLDLIDDVLRVSRIDAGTYELNRCDCDLPALLERSLAGVSADAAAKDLEVAADLGLDVPICADAGALSLVFDQILRNAVKYAHPGGSVAVRIRRSGEAVNVFVSDDGCGIPAEFLPRIGVPFEQGEAEDHRSGRGCGLGLALTKALIDLHGGSLRIRSQPGVGTVVMVRLPLRAEPAVRALEAFPAGTTWLEAAE